MSSLSSLGRKKQKKLESLRKPKAELEKAANLAELEKTEEIGLLSLSELIELREADPTSTNRLAEELATLQKNLPGFELEKKEFFEKGTGKRKERLRVESNVGQTKKRIQDITAMQKDEGLQGQGRLGDINAQIKKLTRQRVTARSARAGSVATLLGRGR